MQVGTKSLVFGVHQIFWHGFTVLLAWIELYGLPNWKECICIFIHDFGYFGCPNMDGKEGASHPVWGAQFAKRYLDSSDNDPLKDSAWRYADLCLLHSRGIAKLYNVPPSKLCWADKLSIKYDPWFLYLPRAILSGEIIEYRKRADDFGEIKADRSHLDWYKWSHDRMIRKAYNRETTPPYEGH